MSFYYWMQIKNSLSEVMNFKLNNFFFVLAFCPVCGGPREEQSSSCSQGTRCHIRELIFGVFINFWLLKKYLHSGLYVVTLTDQNNF